MSDLDELLPRITAGDEEAFALWLASAEASVRSTLRRFARVVDTEAVLQEALLRVWQLAGRIRSDGHPNGSLRFAIVTARNLAVSEARRRAREVSPADDELEAVDPTPLPDPLLREAIRRCFEVLAGKPKQALGMRLASGGRRPDQELAEIAGMRVNTFLQNVTRARRTLTECLGRAGVAAS